MLSTGVLLVGVAFLIRALTSRPAYHRHDGVTNSDDPKG